MARDVAQHAGDITRYVGDLSQLASTRLVTLEEGQERGQRALICQAGGGLDLLVLVDRCLDIGTLAWRGTPLAWQSPNGFRRADLVDAEGEGGQGFARGFGGFLVTCGLDHIRQPEGGHPLHGRLPFTPARLVSHGVDWRAPTPTLFAEAEIVQFRLSHEHLHVARRIEAPVGHGVLRLVDRITNRGAMQVPVRLLYHVNLGFPFLSDGTRVEDASGRPLLTIGPPDATAQSRSVRRAVAELGAPRVNVTHPTIGTLALSWTGDTLPCLQTWTDLRPHTYVAAIEPCTDGVDDGDVRMLASQETLAVGFDVALQ